MHALELCNHDAAKFTAFVVNQVLSKHATFRAFISQLAQSPLVLPVIDISDIEAAESVEALASRAAEEINSSGAEPVTAARVLETMRAWTGRRFAGRTTEDPPSRKARAEVLTEACAAAALEGRGIGGGPADLKNLRAWGSNFRITDQSRYVSGSVGPFTVWLAADLELRGRNSEQRNAEEVVARMELATDAGSAGSSFSVRMRGFVAHGEAVADAIVEEYFRQADGSGLQAPYLPIHQVRAAAAFRCGVMRVLVDRVIEGLVNGSIERAGVQVQLRINSDGDHPDSEPVYSRGGSPRYSMSITREGNPYESPGGAR